MKTPGISNNVNDRVHESYSNIFFPLDWNRLSKMRTEVRSDLKYDLQIFIALYVLPVRN